MVRRWTTTAIALAVAGTAWGAGATAVVATPGAQPVASYQAGDLDPVLDADGIMTFGSTVTTQANDVTVTSDGDLVTTGIITVEGDRQLFLSRRSPLGDGYLWFGSNGILRVGADDTAQAGTAVTELGEDEGFLVAGSTAAGAGGEDFLVVRSARTGQPDHAFGGDGVVTADFEGRRDSAIAALDLPDGRVLAVGTSYSISQRIPALARFTAAGQLDPSFSSDGLATHPLPGGGFEVTDAVLLPDGKLLAVGTDYRDPADTGLALMRIKPDGSLDQTFGVNGITDLELTPNEDYGAAVALTGDGRAVVAGGVRVGDGYQSLLAKVRADGTKDPSFGVGGIVVEGFGSESSGFSDLSIDATGRIVAVGSRSAPGTFDSAALVARYAPAGTPDQGFGSGGRVFLYAADVEGVSASNSAANGVAFDPRDGKIVAAGFRPVDFGQQAVAAWRLYAEDTDLPEPDPVYAIPVGVRQSQPAAKLKVVKGIAGGDGLAGVRFAINRMDKRLLTKEHKCWWAAKPNGVFSKHPAVKSGQKWECGDPQRTMPVSGLAEWKVTLTKRLAPGSYRLLARATDDQGRTSGWRFVRARLT